MESLHSSNDVAEQVVAQPVNPAAGNLDAAGPHLRNGACATEDGARDAAILMRRGEKIEVMGREIHVRPAVLEIWERLVDGMQPLIEAWLSGDIKTLAQLIRTAPKQVAEMLALVCEDEQGKAVPADWFRANCAPNDLMDLVEAMERVNELARFLQRQRTFAAKFVPAGQTPSTS